MDGRTDGQTNRLENKCEYHGLSQGQKSHQENYELYAFFKEIRDKKKYPSTFSVYINDDQNNIHQCHIHIS